ncbi:MAG: CPBP family intramembrane glutamic endopeptidase [Chloroflexota bacterium]
MAGSSFWRGASAHRGFLFFTLGLALLAFVMLRLDLAPLRAFSLIVVLVAAALLALSSLFYVLTPIFFSGEAARARAAYGTHRDILANGVAGAAIGNLIFVPILLAALGVVEAYGAGSSPTADPFSVLAAVQRVLEENTPLVAFLSLVGLDLGLLLVVWLRLLRTGATTQRELGWTSAHLLRNLAIGVGGYVLVVLAAAVVAFALSGFGVVQNQTEQLGLSDASQPVFFLLLAGAGLLAPVAEEVFFRGYIFRAYLTRLGPVWAYVLSAAIFGVLHINLAALLPLIVIGAILAFLYHRTGSLVPPIVAHGLNNTVALIAVYFIQQGV